MKRALVTACVVLPLVLSLWIVSAQSNQPTLQPVERLTVVDSQARIVGPVLGVEANLGSGDPLTWVAFRVNQVVALISVDKNGFTHPNPSSVFFQTADCSGTPYISPNSLLAQPVAVAFPGSTLYVPTNGSVLSTITAQSTSFQPGVCEPFGSQVEVLPATKGPDLSQHFTPPFSLR